MKFEEIVGQALTKDDLHRMVDQMPDGSRGVIVLADFNEHGENPNTLETYWYKNIGAIRDADTLWLIRLFEMFVMSHYWPRQD